MESEADLTCRPDRNTSSATSLDRTDPALSMVELGTASLATEKHGDHRACELADHRSVAKGLPSATSTKYSSWKTSPVDIRLRSGRTVGPTLSHPKPGD